MLTVISILSATTAATLSPKAKPLVVSSKIFSQDHIPRSFHYEQPERIGVCLEMLDSLQDAIDYRLPTGETSEGRKEEALQEVIYKVHDADYIAEVEMLCKKGARLLSPWDSDTYISKNSFDVCVLAQTAWMDGIDHILEAKEEARTAFAVTRPPGHHAVKSSSQGFCIFNFAVGAATYALSKGINKIGIIDFDVHFGNGVADLVAGNEKIRYTSLHQYGIFPNEGQGGETDGNIYNIELPLGTNGESYLPLFKEKAILYIKDFNPDMLIVCAGYDALSKDPLADMNLEPKDYGELAKVIRETFGDIPTLYGLEGGYDLETLPLALKETINVYLDNSS